MNQCADEGSAGSEASEKGLDHPLVEGDALTGYGLAHEGDDEHQLALRDRRFQGSVGRGRSEQAVDGRSRRPMM